MTAPAPLSARIEDLIRRCDQTRARAKALLPQIDRHLAELRRLAKRMSTK